MRNRSVTTVRWPFSNTLLNCLRQIKVLSRYNIIITFVPPTTVFGFRVPIFFGGHEISHIPTSHLPSGPRSITWSSSDVNALIELTGNSFYEALLKRVTWKWFGTSIMLFSKCLVFHTQVPNCRNPSYNFSNAPGNIEYRVWPPYVIFYLSWKCFVSWCARVSTLRGKIVRQSGFYSSS